MRLSVVVAVVAAFLSTSPMGSAAEPTDRPTRQQLAPLFRPPAELADDLGTYRSPLIFDDGRPVKAPDDWQRRREEIRKFWFSAIGAWPPLIQRPTVDVLNVKRRENLTQKTVRIQVAPQLQVDGYLLLPDSHLLLPDGRRPAPAVLVVYYDPETGVGLRPEKKFRDFGYQLARRGFVALSIGWPREYTDRQNPQRQTLSTLAYMAANCHNALAAMPEVDPKRIGVVGHSFGGKWAMFAACLYDKFAAAAWSDPGIVFDETRPNVNYWDPWYLGYEPSRQRTRGLPGDTNPSIGPYRALTAGGHDLHELHALMAPRPFLVSGGAEDRPERWKALNHAVAVNRLLGHEDRVAMTNRPGHSPTEESNEQLYRFFEHFLGHDHRR